MTRRVGAAAVVAALALPAVAGADVNNGNDCTYGQTEEVSVGTVPHVVVYAGTGDAGMTGTALVAGGVCTDGLAIRTPVANLDGAAAEAGAGTPAGGPGGYAIADGDNANVDILGVSDGYAGLSTYETGARGSCAGGGTGSNSGGCLEIKGIASLPVPAVACGNTSGNTWAASARDGCAQPEL
ncbi:MAG TPA: hypothetical protein VGW10_00305 [Solirubrobacteraceae bacterium]|nr:hypothetical protein [Solirubrobacteraceae bacterium]